MPRRNLFESFSNESYDQDDCLYVCYDVFHVFELAVSICAFGTVSVIGVVGNVVNMIIFVRQLLKDSMTVGLFALSFTDFSVSLAEMTMSTIYLANYIFPYCPVDLWALAYVGFGWTLYTGYLISGWITAMIALERCFCVVAPFRVKQLFTRRRCVIVVIIIYTVHLLPLLPLYIAERMQWVVIEDPNALFNSTLSIKLYYTITLTDFADEVEKALDATAGLFLFLASQAVLTICSLWMTYSLKATSLVRSHKSAFTEKLASSEKLSSNLTPQEKRLVKMVLSLAVLQTVCNLPRLILTVFYNVCTDISVKGDKNLSTMIWSIASLFNQVCCTSNTFCYYFLSSKHRNMFKKLFGLKS
ncbi:growth hormone secretagogue receptor type 1 [Biomphalaria pfeifferi]|uniref:Growth hormone secretagogue receptor type 1 n=1 Tax=Biomphalaria pfeifferi TaxID=112525 RepID=A0AAD8EZX6_BIOPF|nr:growth hormone secretagogue receptor type 1 [Biomphalaria pfeifferi]